LVDAFPSAQETINVVASKKANTIDIFFIIIIFIL
jgi:hypothetical protein